MRNELVENIDRLHTTEMGDKCISKNLSLIDADAVQWCRSKILDEKADINRKG